MSLSTAQPLVALSEAAKVDSLVSSYVDASPISVSDTPYALADEQARIVLMSASPSAESFSQVLAALREAGIHFAGIDSLSEKAWLLALAAPLSEGEFEQLDTLIEEIESYGFDCNYLAEGVALWLQPGGLACFDMDSTLIQVEVIDELAKAAGVGEQVAAVTEAAMRGEIDFTESFSQRMSKLNGLSETVLADIAASLPVSEGMPTLIKGLQALGYKTAILSGGFDYFARHLQNLYGFDHVYANQLDIEDGKVTGKVVGKVVDGARKAELLQSLAAEHQLDLSRTIAVGDGANDLPMLGLAGLGVAFRAKPIVRAQAQYNVSQLGLDGVLCLLGQRP